MAVIVTCPCGGQGHGFGCCAAFARKPAADQLLVGRRVPAPELTHEAMCLTEKAVELLDGVATGQVWWVIQRSGTYGHRAGRRYTKLLKALAGHDLLTLPGESGWCLPTDLGRAALAFHRPNTWSLP